MSYYAQLTKNSKAELEKVTRESDRLMGTNFERDERYWRLKTDQAGNGSAIIRFLPRHPKEDFPFVKRFSYGFKGPTGRWYIELSPTTIGLPDPVAERNSLEWNSGTEAGKDWARKHKRRLRFISNVLVIKHDANKEDEGKVFLYEYGQKIYEKIYDKLHPVDSDMMKFDPTHPAEGANFRLRQVKKDGFPNYDKSEFDLPAPIANGKEIEIDAILDQLIPLLPEIDKSRFKSYDELKAKFEQAFGKDGIVVAWAGVEAPTLVAEDPVTDEAPPWKEEGEDAELDYFQKLSKRRASK